MTTDGDGALADLERELEGIAERLADLAYDALRAQLDGSRNASKSDPAVRRERLLSRARQAVARAQVLVRQAEDAASTQPTQPSDAFDQAE